MGHGGEGFWRESGLSLGMKATKAAKATKASEAHSFTDIPNIGKAMAADFKLLGLTQPAQLAAHEPLALYLRLCEISRTRHDPCVLDTFMAAVDFMQGAPARPWWDYTALRKRLHASV